MLSLTNEGGASASLVAQGFLQAKRNQDSGNEVLEARTERLMEVGSGTNGVIKVIQINARRSATLLALPATASTATGVSRPTTSYSAMNESTPASNTGAMTTVGLPGGDNALADADSSTDDGGVAGLSALAAATSEVAAASDAPGPGGAGLGAGASASTAGATTAPDVLAFPGRSSGKASAASVSTNAITSVAWAPSCGRSYHLIATGGRDGRVRVWKVRPGEELGGGDVSMGMGDPDDADAEERWSAMVVADFEHHRSAVTRVEWNVTGTILASAGNDGRVRLWKATARNVWRPAGSVGVEQAESEAPQTQTDSAGGLNGNGVDMDTA
ncbi:hypothetical protein D9619_010930 [Psilocybe cf. subviscida]|uniref:Anaphase-promoting complex subunit 4 WD40 domain-containing protein n=1 Tax=Psilocybe cf. subviscida TaxID=2480587 RepID=A0A8H5B8K7_9AGAR|nr:hypothetical protein D9619_010930 [Psilocybe cf. subviscida]